jgi:tetratricopeptide (TPR) repeat protein
VGGLACGCLANAPDSVQFKLPNKSKKTSTQTDKALIETVQAGISTGIFLGKRGLLADAAEALDQALAVCGDLKRNRQESVGLKVCALASKGAVLGDDGRHTEAIECYDLAMTLYRQIDEHCGEAEMLPLYAISLMNKGWSLIKLGLHDQGFRCHDEALGLRRKIAASGEADALSDVARSLYNCGEGYFLAERFAAALPAFAEAEAILRKLLLAGGEELVEEDLAYVLAAKGDTLQMHGNMEEALRVNDEALALLKLLSGKTENPKLASAIAATLNGRNTILRKLRKSPDRQKRL